MGVSMAHSVSGTLMESQTTHILPDEPSKTEGSRLRRQKLLSFLRNPEPAWRGKDHPEFTSGVIAWVKNIRLESERRISSTQHPEMFL